MITSNQQFASDPYVEVRVDGPLGSIIIRRDHVRNALCRTTVSEIQQALADLHQETKVRAVAITGAGAAFCAGTDLHELADSAFDSDAQRQWFTDVNSVKELFESMLRFPKPLIAAVNGPAMGTGFGLVLACDIVLASSEAKFGLPEPRLGLVSGVVLPLMAFRLGSGVASFLSLTAANLDCDHAAKIGIIHQTCRHETLWVQAKQLAEQIAELPFESLSMSKRSILENSGESLSTCLTNGAAVMATARTTNVAKEGLTAFKEKRPANWSQAMD